MARKKTSAVSMIVKPAPKVGAQARKIKRDFLKRQKAERESRALMIIEAPKPVRKTTKRKTTKRKTTTTSSGVSPTCSRAGRRLKVLKLSAAGRVLASATCKTKGTKTTATKKRATTTAKKRTSAVKSIISPVTRKATATRKSATRKTAVKKVTAKRSVRRSAAASKLARIKKIVC
jgi:hypothetical protein